jgi:muconolactone delta-isomerase
MTTSMLSPQLERIARLLHVDVSEVHGLDDLSDAQLRTVLDRIGELVFAGQQERFARIASLSKLLPGPLAGKLAEKFLPPPLAARTAEMLEPAKARDLVTKVRVSYLADLAMSLDPTRSEQVVKAIPAVNVGQVARELFGRGEYATMAEFAGTVTLEALFAAFEVATPHDLFEVAPLLVWNDNLDAVLSQLPVEKILPLVHELVRTSREEAVSGSRYTVIDRMAPVMACVPTERVAEVAKVLFEGGEYEAMAQFAGTVPLEALFAAFEVAEPHDLFEIAPLLVWNDNLTQVLSDLPVDKIIPLVEELVRTSREEVDAGSPATVIERMAPVMACVPVERVAEVAKVLFERAEYEAMAQFAGTVPPKALFAAFEVATPHDLFEIAPLLVWNDNLTQVLSELPVDRITSLVNELVRTTQDEVAGGAGDTLIERLAPVMACVPAIRVGEVAAVLFERGEYEAMALFSGVIPPPSILAAVAVADARDLLGVVPLLEWNDNLADAINQLEVSILDDILNEVVAGELWSEASYLIDRLDPKLIDHALTRVNELPAGSLATMRAAADAGLLTGQACALLERAEALRA